MAVIYSYPIATPKLEDLILGTSLGGKNPTKSYTVESLANLVGGGVNKIIAGTDISISPADGLGTITINSTVDPGVTSIIAGSNVVLGPASGVGDVTISVPNVVKSVTSGNVNLISIGGTPENPTVTATVAPSIVDGGLSLVTANTIYDFVIGQGYIPYSENSTASISFVNDSTSLGGGTPSNFVVPTQLAVKTYVDNAVTGQLVYQGGYNAATNTPDLTTSPNSILRGWTYTVTAAGTFFGETVEIGDLLIAEIDNPTGLGNWTTVQNNIDLATESIPGIANFPVAGGLSITSGAVSLPDTGAIAGSYSIPDITVDAKGRVTAIANATTGFVSDFSSAAGTFVTVTNNVSAEGSVDIGTVDLSATGTPSSSTFLRGDNTWATITDEDNYVDGISFNTADGVLTLTRTGTLPDLTQDLDGRYALTSDIPANIVQTIDTTSSTFIDLTPTSPASGAVTVTAALSATGTPSASNFLRGDNTWSTALTSVGITSPLSTIAISNSPLTANGNIGVDLSASGVTPGSYTNSNITIDAYGRITVASNGTPGGVTDFTNSNGTFISYTTENTAATGSVTTGSVDLSATGTPSATTFLRGDNSWTDQADVVSGATTLVEIEVKNLEGAALSKGDPVYLKGTVGASTKMEVGLADASNAAKMPSVGLLKQDLAINGEGFAVVTGTLKNLATTPIDGATATTGDTIYVKPGGGLTLTKPTGSTNFIQNVGQIGRVSTVSSGSILASCIMRANDVPNLPTGKIWVGDGNTAVSDVVYLDETNSRMGLNTITPSQALHVSGNTRITGAIYDSNNTPGASGQVLSSTVTGTDWVSLSEISGVDGSGTTNYVAKWSDTDTITDSVIFDNGNFVGIGTTNQTINGEILRIAGDLFINSAGSATVPSIAIGDANSGIYASASGQISITTQGNQRLNIDGSGNIAMDTDTLYVDSVDNRVGIGTTSPQQLLSISNTSNNAYLHCVAGTSNLGGVWVGDSDSNYVGGFLYDNSINSSLLYTNGAERLRIDSSGNVGIGTTSPTSKLTVAGDILTTADSNDNVVRAYFSDNTYTEMRGYGLQFSRASSYIRPTSDSTSAMYFGTSGATWNSITFDSNVYQFQKDGATSLYINSLGNVGIGTTAPAYKLAAYGSSTDSEIVASFGSSNDTNEYTAIGLSGFIYSNGATKAGLALKRTTLYGAGELHFLNNTTTDNSDMTLSDSRMMINSSGNVGIGTTSPGAPLSFGKAVYGAPSSEDFFRIKFQDFGGIMNDVGIGQTASGSLGFNTQANGVTSFNRGTSGEQMRIDSNGNVGIGTTSPAFKTQLYDSGNTVLGITAGTANYAALQFGSTADATRGAIEYYTGDDSLRLKTGNNNEKVRIDSAGNVGIGETDPDGYWVQAQQLVLSGGNNGITIKSTSAGNGRIVFTDTKSSTAGLSDGGMIHYDHTSDSMRLHSNGSERMRINSGGDISFRDTSNNEAFYWDASTAKLGIGTTSPTATLTAFNTGSDTAGYNPAFAIGDGNYHWRKTTDSSKLILDTYYGGWNPTFTVDRTSGNVGIGTTAPGAKLDVNGPAQFTGGSYASGSESVSDAGIVLPQGKAIYSENTGNYLRNIIQHTSGGDIQIGQGNTAIISNITFQPGSSGDIKFYPSGSQDVTFKSDGNVGIGTTSPTYTLDVEKNSNGTTGVQINNPSTGTAARSTVELLSDSANLNIYATSAAYNGVSSWADSGVLSTSSNTSGGLKFNAQAGGLTFQTGANTKMVLDSAGNVGIGTTAPNARLEVKDSVNNLQMRVGSLTPGISPYIRLQGKNTANTLNYYGDIALDAENGKLVFNDPGTSGGSIGTNPMVLDSNGNVGIGTTAPSAPLTVKTNSSGVSIRALGRSADGYSFLTFRNSTDSATLGEIGISNAQNMQFYTAGTERLRIGSTGQVKFNAYTSASAFTGVAVANLAVDSSGNIITQAAAGLAVAEVTAGATVAAAASTLYVFTASSGSVSTLTLPASPAVGDTIKISNIGGLANIVGANTNNIMGVSTDMTIDVATSSFELIWTGISATGWVILSNV